MTPFDERPLLSPPGDCMGQPHNSGNKRPSRSPRGVPWLSKAADLASKFHREPPWRRPTLLVPVGSVHLSSRVCCYHSGLFKPKQPNPTHQRSNSTLEGPIPPLGTRQIDRFFGLFGVLAQPWTIQGIGRHWL
ncbi:hypothetical protein CRG98_018213 [Punica granatum]|uniref:Uncharacterized protein n=1 Tax=Punica granatum TaxID=22663 RepID=A0A2I0JYM1_PUNGR|nr:hypothetical protein CRG98_018213 [Punica granatum]